MKKILWSVLAMLPYFLYAQESGVKFEKTSSWPEIQAKAKAENKYVFMDCYASWCGPCKEMDKAVYTNLKVADYLNANFISVKVQMDQTAQDNLQIKNWYSEVKNIGQNYHIAAYPTFLFFSPDGSIVHRGLGFKDSAQFVSLAKDVMDTAKQYYTLLRKFQQKHLSFAAMPTLAAAAKEFGDKALANKVAKDYIDNYLMKLGEKDLYTKAHIEFIVTYIPGSKDQSFHLFYPDGRKTDAVMDKGYSQNAVDYVIAVEHIEPNIFPEDQTIVIKSPNWEKMRRVIRMKYDEKYADRTILGAQIRWYSYKKDYPEIAKYTIRKIEKDGQDTTGMGNFTTNNMIWEVFFEHVSDKTLLNKAIKWEGKIVKMLPDDEVSLDTYANLLYKAGRMQEAIACEEKAKKFNDEHASKNKADPDKVYQETLDKMKKGVKTWDDPE